MDLITQTHPHEESRSRGGPGSDAGMAHVIDAGVDATGPVNPTSP